MARNQSKITTDLTADDALVQGPRFRMDADDRQYIDSQIRGVQRHLEKLLLNGSTGTYGTVDAASGAITAGTVLTARGRNVGRYDGDVFAGAVIGIALLAVPAGGMVPYATSGVLQPEITGITYDTTSPVIASPTTGRLEVKTSPAEEDVVVGTIDAYGAVTFGTGGGGTTIISGDTSTATCISTCAIGDVLCSAAQADKSKLTKATAAAIAAGGAASIAIAITAVASAPATVTFANAGDVVAAATVGLSAGAAAYGIVTSFRVVRKTNPDVGDYVVGTIDTQGNVTVNPFRWTGDFDVKSFGAVGDRTTDDSNAFRNAVAAAAFDPSTINDNFASRRVDIPKGGYKLGKPVHAKTSGQHIRGSGMQSSSVEAIDYVGPLFWCSPDYGSFPVAAGEFAGGNAAIIADEPNHFEHFLELREYGSGLDLHGKTAFSVETIIKMDPASTSLGGGILVSYGGLRFSTEPPAQAFGIWHGGSAHTPADSVYFQLKLKSSKTTTTLAASATATVQVGASAAFAPGDEIRFHDSGPHGRELVGIVESIPDGTHVVLTRPVTVTVNSDVYRAQIYSIASAVGTLSADGDYHVVECNYDGISMRVYIDGVLEASAAIAGIIVQEDWETVLFGRGAYQYFGQSPTFDTVRAKVASIRVSDVARHTSNHAPTAAKYGFDSNTLYQCNFDTMDGVFVVGRCRAAIADSDPKVCYIPHRFDDITNYTIQRQKFSHLRLNNAYGEAIGLAASHQWNIKHIEASSSKAIIRTTYNCWSGSAEDIRGVAYGPFNPRIGIFLGGACYYTSLKDCYIVGFRYGIVSMAADLKLEGHQYILNNRGQILLVSCGTFNISATGSLSDENSIAGGSPVDFSIALVQCGKGIISGIGIGQAENNTPAVIIDGDNFFTQLHVVFSGSGLGAPAVASIFDFHSAPLGQVIVDGDKNNTAPWFSGGSPASARLTVRPRDTEGDVSVTLSGTTHTLSRENWMDRQVNFAGALSATCAVTVPKKKTSPRWIYNATTGGHDITLKAAGGSTIITVAPGARTVIASDGTDIFEAS